MVLALLMAVALVIGITGPLGVSAAAKVKLSASKKTVYVGEQFALELTGAKGDVKWSSSSKKVATVKDGLVTAVKTGKATIKAKDSKTNKTYSCKITVKKNSLSDKTLKLKAGESASIALKGNTPTEWSSSDESIAIVNSGTVTAVKEGKATITAKAGKKNGCLIEGMACPGGCVAGAGTNLPIDKAKAEVCKFKMQAEKELPDE